MSPKLDLIIADVLRLLQAIRPDYEHIGPDGYETFADLIDAKLYEAYTELKERTPHAAAEAPAKAEAMLSLATDVEALFDQFHDGKVTEEQVEGIADDLHRELSALV